MFVHLCGVGASDGGGRCVGALGSYAGVMGYAPMRLWVDMLNGTWAQPIIQNTRGADVGYGLRVV